MSADDEFHEPFLRFRIVKPPSWSFMPPAWSPIELLRNADDDAPEWVEHANTPFVCFMRHHESDDHVYPTTQATARPVLAVPTPEQTREVLEMQAAFLEQTFSAFRLHSTTPDRIIAGHRAAGMVAEYELPAERDGEWRTFGVRVRMTMIFTPRVAFTIGMSSSTDPDYFDEADFDLSLRSITLD